MTISPSASTDLPIKKNRHRVLSLRSVFHGLARELCLLAPVYVRLHAAHPALSPYPTLPSLLARLTTGPRDDAKNELLAALVSACQSTPHRLWVATLLRAFWPMLAKLWKQLFGSDPQERLALLLFSFQGAIRHVDPSRDPVRIAMYVRQAMRRRAIVALTKEVRWNEVGFGEDADMLADPRAPDPPLRDRCRFMQRLLRRGELSAHVRRTHPSLSRKEQARVYHKLRRNLRQLLVTMREQTPGDSIAANELAPQTRPALTWEQEVEAARMAERAARLRMGLPAQPESR
jgi:hypothetical protein